MASCEAARRVHDARIGKGRVYHLFRLPHVTEQKLQRHALTGDAMALATAFESKDKALQTLETLAREPDGTPTVRSNLEAQNPLIPTIVGKLADVPWRCWASKLTMPYFTATD
jgi:hypothetical protein